MFGSGLFQLNSRIVRTRPFYDYPTFLAFYDVERSTSQLDWQKGCRSEYREDSLLYAQAAVKTSNVIIFHVVVLQRAAQTC